MVPQMVDQNSKRVHSIDVVALVSNHSNSHCSIFDVTTVDYHPPYIRIVIWFRAPNQLLKFSDKTFGTMSSLQTVHEYL